MSEWPKLHTLFAVALQYLYLRAPNSTQQSCCHEENSNLVYAVKVFLHRLDYILIHLDDVRAHL